MINPLPERKDAIIVSLERDTREMEELARAMNYNVRGTFVQNRKAPHPKYFVGSGKVEEIGRRLKELGAERPISVAVVNSPLKPTQIFHLQNAWDITVFDRTRLILEIFTNRARSQEARLQVELAKLEYEVPLVKELIHRARMGEHPGYMAGGEYQVDQYYEMIRKRIKKIRMRLRTVKKDRSEKRRHRREEGFFLVSIAGYTNAGKSMLHKALTKEETIIEDKVFSTLVTLTRRGEGGYGGAFLFSDTVGFIRDLPPWMIEAFHSTLEEIFLADIVLLIVDISEDVGTVVQKVLTSYGFLRVDDEVPPIILVLNKVDLINKGDPDGIKERIDMVMTALDRHDLAYIDHFAVSAKEHENLDGLLNGMIEGLEKLDYARKTRIVIRNHSYIGNEDNVKRYINWLYKDFVVLSDHRTGDSISLVILRKKHDLDKMRAHAKRLGVVFEI